MGIVGVGQSSILQGGIQFEADIGHQLVDAVACLLGQLDLVVHIVLYFLSFDHGLSGGVQPLFRSQNMRSVWILLNCIVNSLFVDLFKLLLVLSLFHFLLDLPAFDGLSLHHFRLVLGNLLLLVIQLLLSFQLGHHIHLLELIGLGFLHLLCSLPQIFEVQSP